MNAPSVAVALAAAAADASPTLSWLDGGSRAGSFLGVHADDEIVADDLAPLHEVERRWRADPSALWLGWITYDLGAGALLGRSPRVGRLPGLCARRFSAWARFGPPGVELHGGFTLDARADVPAAAWPWSPLRAALAPTDYRDRVARAREHIAAGDTYQINLSQRFAATWAAGRGEPRDVSAAYRRLRERAPASMGGLLRWRGADGWVMSNSPETLLDVRLAGPDRDVARSWPIKGTRPRVDDEDVDAEHRRALQRSAKDQAEHVMIVDLVRNDLGALAMPGSVSADPVPTLVSLPTVHHLVSEVRARLRPTWTLRGLVDAMFPGGSITGAPKRRTVELIDALEGEARELYCGSLFVLEPDGLRFDIAIRTAIVDPDGLTVRGGGGIVIDSDPESERLETVAKVRAFAGP